MTCKQPSVECVTTAEAVFSVWLVQRLYNKIPDRTVLVLSDRVAREFSVGDSHGKFVV
jgi:hypothetical protein